MNIVYPPLSSLRGDAKCPEQSIYSLYTRANVSRLHFAMKGTHSFTPLLL